MSKTAKNARRQLKKRRQIVRSASKVANTKGFVLTGRRIPPYPID